LLKVVFSLVPRFWTTATIARGMPEATMAYSVAVAPDSSFTKRKITVFNPNDLARVSAKKSLAVGSAQRQHGSPVTRESFFWLFAQISTLRCCQKPRPGLRFLYCWVSLRRLRYFRFSFQNALIGLNGFDCSVDEPGTAAKALAKAAPAPNFGGAVTGEMSTSAMNEARCVAVWTKKAGPIVFVSIALGSRRWLISLCWLRVCHLTRRRLFRVRHLPKQAC
jgi:hypothetical protein